MLIGCDLGAIDDFTLSLLCNPEVLEVNQDPLGMMGVRNVFSPGVTDRKMEGKWWEIQ